jgi:CYTH domain-containing protein
LVEHEYGLLSRLPGHQITKTRLSFPALGLDIFGAPHRGLLIAEMAFTDDESMATFAPPAWCGREITHVAEYEGSPCRIGFHGTR